MIQVADTPTIDLTLFGRGNQNEPYLLQASATIELDELSNVNAPSPANGNVLGWNGTQWAPVPPTTAPSGAIAHGCGLTGDGSGGAPLAIAAGSGLTCDAPSGVVKVDDAYIDARIAAKVQEQLTGIVGPIPRAYTGMRLTSDQTAAATFGQGAGVNWINAPAGYYLGSGTLVWSVSGGTLVYTRLMIGGLHNGSQDMATSSSGGYATTTVAPVIYNHSGGDLYCGIYGQSAYTPLGFSAGCTATLTWVSPPQDTTPPTILSTTPLANAVTVPLASAVTATFSEALITTNLGINLTRPGGTAATTMAYDANTRKATWTPTAPLLASTIYTATVSGARDLAGNLMSPVTWSFTTAAA